MGKQPYMPLYVGDWMKDTRVLPMNVRGIWIDLILFMWDNHTRGELIGSVDEIARMVGCAPDEARFALLLLQQKKTADIVLLPSGEFHIVSRRMKRDIEISKIRSVAGKNGVSAKRIKSFAAPFASANLKQNPDIEYDNDSIIVIGAEGKNSILIKAKYVHEKPVRIYDLQEYFKVKEQLIELQQAGWTKFVPFMKANPAGMFEDHNHLYQAFKKYSMSPSKNGVSSKLH